MKRWNKRFTSKVLVWAGIGGVIGSTAMMLLLPGAAYADAFSQLQTNVTTTAKDIMGVITGVAGATTGTKVGWHAWMKSLSAGDQMNTQKHNEGMKHTLIWGGGITAVGAVATAVTSAMTNGMSGT